MWTQKHFFVVVVPNPGYNFKSVSNLPLFNGGILGCDKLSETRHVRIRTPRVSRYLYISAFVET